jgi:hypothetical protein
MPFELSADDRASMVGFLWLLRHLLAYLVYDRSDLVSVRTREHLAAAWEELEREGRFREAVNQVAMGEWDQELLGHGLHDAPLRLELHLFGRAYADVVEDGRKVVRGKAPRGILKRALRIGNIVLGSIGGSIPGGSAIKEFKEASESALDEPLSAWQRLRARLGRRPVPAFEEPAGAELA